MTTAPRFSVIVPVFNGAKTIRRALDSVLEQSWPACEIIVVDDGSVDDTQAQVRAYGDRVMYLHQANQGVSAARNCGARAASGDWLAFLDADDWYLPERLRWHAEWIARDPGVDFLTGDYEYRRPNGMLIGRSMERCAAGRDLLERAAGRREISMTVPDFESFIEHHFGDTHTLTLPRETFMYLGGYPVGRAVCEDVNLLIRLCARSRRAGVVCRPMAVYLIHEQGATRSDPIRAQRETVDALQPLMRTLQSAPLPVIRGLRGCLRRARLDLAYAMLKRGRRLEAFQAAMPLVTDNPGLKSIRDVVQIGASALRN
ncbi:MAG: glycosyltransferase family 2 protein [Burkholderiales bacterium]